MPSVADLVEESALHRLASPEAFQQGATSAGQDGVKLIVFGPLQVIAEVTDNGAQDNGPYQVELRSAGKQLIWSCTCQEAQDGAFCRHCVAAGLETWRRSPPGRR